MEPIGHNTYSTRFVLGFLLGDEYPRLLRELTGQEVPKPNEIRTIIQAIFVALDGKVTQAEVSAAGQLDPVERMRWFNHTVEKIGPLLTIHPLPHT